MSSINGENLAPGPGQGAATILGNSLVPLHVLMQGDARRALAKKADAAKKAKQQEADYKDWSSRINRIDNTTGPTYQRLINDNRTDLTNQLYAIHANKDLSREEQLLQSQQLIDKHQIRGQSGKQIDETLAKVKATVAADNELNKDLYLQDVHASQYAKLPDGSLDLSHPIDPLDYDLTTPERMLEDVKYLNVPQLYKNFATALAPKATVQRAAGGRPGQMATTYSDEVRFWKRNPDGSLYKNKKGEKEMDITDALLDQALGNERIKRDLQGMQAAHEAARAAGLQKQATGAPLTPDEALAVNTEPTLKDFLGRRLTAQAVASHSEAQRYVPVPRAAAGTKGGVLKSGQATVTPTSDFGLSVDDNGGPVVETVANPKKGGLLNFLTPKVQRTTQQVQTVNNHYPHTGVSFATEKAPYLPLVVDSNELTTLGSDGTPSEYGANKTNSQVKLNATDRSFVLEINGKRLGLNKAGTSADAYQEMRKLIDEMTPAQAQQTVMKAYYHGTVIDKGAVSGDGTGGKAKLLGYKGESGRLLTEAEATALKQAGEVLTPVYDTKERQVKVMRPATAQLDAQAARQTPGYNPRQRTPQEADLIRRLEAKGGRVIDPYHTTDRSDRPTFIPVKDASSSQQPADKSGGMFETLPPRAVNGIKMTGGQDVLGWGRGGSVYKAPKKKW